MFKHIVQNIVRIFVFFGVLIGAWLGVKSTNQETLAAFTHAGGDGCFTISLPLVVRSGGGTSSDMQPAPIPVAPATVLNCHVEDAADMVDFNGDGYADLAIGIPNEDKNGLVTNSGAVQILFGTAEGLSAEGNQMWTQTSIFGAEEPGDQFGWALAAGDFDGDGTTDLAVGAPGETRDGLNEAGEVNIIYGYPTQGLTANGTQTFAQGAGGVAGLMEAGDRFGGTLISGDFNGDGYDDLAVGVPQEGLESEGIAEMGAVNILYGSELGLQTADDQILHPGLETVSLTPGALDHFASALASADFDGDGYDDLAVGIPGYDILGADNVGAVLVFKGSAAGLSVLDEQVFRQEFNGVMGAAEAYDGFGASLAAGDFNGNGIGDLAIGVPGESVLFEGDDFSAAGAVNVLYGSAVGGGLSGSGNQIFHQGMEEVLGQPETLDRFGLALTAADFNGDGADDLAVGVPNQNGTASGQGFVQVFFSNGSLLDMAGQQLWAQGLVEGAPEVDDAFGYSLTAGDYDGDGFADLIAGTPFEDVLVAAVTYVDAGALHAIYGAASGLTAVGNQIWYQEVDGVPDVAEAEDRFGWGLGR